MIRIIHFAGALLGTLIGFALGLALLQRAGGLIEEANRPAFLTAFARQLVREKVCRRSSS